MPECPKCHQPISSRAIACPYCRTSLKAHGHPGMTLYRATSDEPLCLTCQYHLDDTCNFPKRPDAMDCTLYRDINQPSAAPAPGSASGFQVRLWFKRNLVWFLLLGLLLVSLLWTLMK